MTVDVVLPVLDEVGALPWILERFPDGYRPIVVDNGSTDGSGDLARRHGALVVDEPVPGFGSACWAGLQAASAEVVCFMDGDASIDPSDLPIVADPVLDDRADLVIAARRASRGAWPLHARLANRYLARALRRRTGLDLADIGPLRAVRRELLLEVGMADRRSGWPLEMVLRGAEAGWRIEGTEARYLPREGRSKVTGTVRGTITAVSDMGRLLR